MCKSDSTAGTLVSDYKLSANIHSRAKELLIIGGVVGRDFSGRRLRTIIIIHGIRDSATVISTTTTRIMLIPSELFGLFNYLTI